MVYSGEKNRSPEEVLEIPQEVLEKISSTSGGQNLVDERSVSDLKFVSVADSKYILPKRNS